MRIDSHLYRGNINKNLRVVYNYNFEPSGQYQTIVERDNGNIIINPSFSITISEGFERDRLFVPANKYYPFATLLNTAVKLISDNLYEIFPNVHSNEFEVDSRVLERFQTEQAMTTVGMTMMPSVWVDESGGCYPAIKVTTLKCGTIVIPLEDAIPISKLLHSFEPHSAGYSILRIIGKIN